MTRQQTPDILAEIINPAIEEQALRQSLRWDYTQAGDQAQNVIGHAIAIKRSEKRASQAVVDAGQHLQAVKAALPHGQWEDWLRTEFGMSASTARNMMAVSERFAKTPNIGVLQASILYMLAGDSVPEPARVEVIEAAQTGRVTVAEARRTVARHTNGNGAASPSGGAGKAQAGAGKCTVCGRALSAAGSVGRACGPTCAAKLAARTSDNGDGDTPVLSRDLVAIWLDPEVAERVANAADSGARALASLDAADVRALAQALRSALGW